MSNYECAVIFAPTTSGEALQDRSRHYTEIITSRGGTLLNLDDWGKRTLAYEIDHHREGYYHFYRFEGGGEIVNELNRQLRIDESVIRHMIVRDEVALEAAAEDVAEEPADEEQEDEAS